MMLGAQEDGRALAGAVPWLKAHAMVAPHWLTPVPFDMLRVWSLNNLQSREGMLPNITILIHFNYNIF